MWINHTQIKYLFTEDEIKYIKSQRLTRIATSASFSTRDIASCQSDVVPVGFDFDDKYFYVGGINILKSTNYKNVLKIIKLL